MRNVKILVALSLGTALIGGAAFGEDTAGRAMTSVPSSSVTVTDWYKQPVYDKSDSKIGSISDVLVSPNGQVSAVILGVGGVVGSEKDVAVPFDSIKKTTKNDKTYLTMDTTQDALKSAPGFKYDSNTTTWVPDKSSK
jgi:sporulation protein YlmC with PRC-barrel domain